jgi:hypothetical protein
MGREMKSKWAVDKLKKLTRKEERVERMKVVH